MTRLELGSSRQGYQLGPKMCSRVSGPKGLT